MLKLFYSFNNIYKYIIMSKPCITCQIKPMKNGYYKR